MVLFQLLDGFPNLSRRHGSLGWWYRFDVHIVAKLHLRLMKLKGKKQKAPGRKKLSFKAMTVMESQHEHTCSQQKLPRLPKESQTYHDFDGDTVSACWGVMAVDVGFIRLFRSWMADRAGSICFWASMASALRLTTDV